jgi:hypothetical protein
MLGSFTTAAAERRTGVATAAMVTASPAQPALLPNCRCSFCLTRTCSSCEYLLERPASAFLVPGSDSGRTRREVSSLLPPCFSWLQDNKRPGGTSDVSSGVSGQASGSRSAWACLRRRFHEYADRRVPLKDTPHPAGGRAALRVGQTPQHRPAARGG